MASDAIFLLLQEARCYLSSSCNLKRLDKRRFRTVAHYIAFIPTATWFISRAYRTPSEHSLTDGKSANKVFTSFAFVIIPLKSPFIKLALSPAFSRRESFSTVNFNPYSLPTLCGCSLFNRCIWFFSELYCTEILEINKNSEKILRKQLFSW